MQPWEIELRALTSLHGAGGMAITETIMSMCHAHWPHDSPEALASAERLIATLESMSRESSDEPTLPTPPPSVLTAPSSSRGKGKARTQHTSTKRVVSSSRDPMAAAQPSAPISAEFTY